MLFYEIRRQSGPSRITLPRKKTLMRVKWKKKFMKNTGINILLFTSQEIK